ncbi:MAG: hypothetical protein AMXMBFR46_23910 [Acidimicrobiia bacterium]
MSRETVYRRLRAGGLHLNRPQHSIPSPDPEYAVNKRRWRARRTLKPGEVFYSADECNRRATSAGTPPSARSGPRRASG